MEDILKQSLELVEKYGSINAAARAAKIPRTTLQARVARAKKAELAESRGYSHEAIKGFTPQWECRNYQYKLGKTFLLYGEPEACHHGFHACQRISDVFRHYPLISMGQYTFNKFANVGLGGTVLDRGDKMVSNKITILNELDFKDIIRTIREQTYKDSVSKDILRQSKAVYHYDSYERVVSTTPKTAFAMVGSKNEATISGASSTVMVDGNRNTVTVGADGAQCAVVGFDNTIIMSRGGESIVDGSSNVSIHLGSGLVVSKGTGSIVITDTIDHLGCGPKLFSVGENGCIVAFYPDPEELTQYRVLVGYVGEDGIKANTLYFVRDGKFVEYVSYQARLKSNP